jgi:hypothetical protein
MYEYQIKEGSDFMPELVFRTLREEVTDAIRMKILKGEIGMGEEDH